MKQASIVGVSLVFLFSILAMASTEESESFYYYYYKEKIPLVAETQSIAVYDEDAQGPPEDVIGLLSAAGYPDTELRSFPVPGWTIALLRSASDTPSVSGVAPVIAKLIELDSPPRFFFSPVFAVTSGEPLLITPSILVKFESGVSESRIHQLLASAGARGAKKEPFGGMENSFRVTTADRSGFRVLEVACRLAESPEVIYAEPNMAMTGRTSSIPNDPLFIDSWGLHNTGQFPGAIAGIDINVSEAWDHTTGSQSVIVVVIDSGVQHDHPDINLIPGADLTRFPSPEGDGRPGNDCDVHGTPVAGVISGIINNSIGTTGVAPTVKIASARALVSALACDNRVGFEISWLVDALQWAVDNGANITNNSYTVASPTSALTEKFQDTYNKGIVHFAGAGNAPLKPVVYPANLPTVIAVSSIDWDGQLSSFSSFGPQIAFSAPGSRIRTTDRTGSIGWDPGDYVIADGTSFASPMAAGVAALILSVSPGLSPQQVEAIMRATAVDLGEPGFDEHHGWGLVNAGSAVVYPFIFSDGFESGDTSQWSTTLP